MRCLEPDVDFSAGIESFVSKDDEFFKYADETSDASCIKALNDLEAYVRQEGPFDAVMAFSQGAGLAASLIISKIQQAPIQQRLYPLFKCAVIFCGAVPEDPGALRRGEVRRSMDFEHDGEIIEVPTAHIWGAHDELYPDFGPVLSRLCRKDIRTDFVHQGGHEVPSSKSPDTVSSVVRVIERTIERALEAQ